MSPKTVFLPMHYMTIFNSATVVTRDLNARHRELEMSRKKNNNGVTFHHFFRDYPDATLLGSSDATHKLDYAFILNGRA